MQVNFTNYSHVYVLRNTANHPYSTLLSNDLLFYEFSHLCSESKQMIIDDFVIDSLLFPQYSFHELLAIPTATCCFSDIDSAVGVSSIIQFTFSCKLLINVNNFVGTKALTPIIHPKTVNFQDLSMFNTNLIF